ncbi:DUF4232 domain-containing protein [Catenuloplanes atrovinosus]|uniref:DUF4232 domain-containing protein n=1 Tax=Catenuloplanes atrovinosus TaxID=137266 RepID=A0AAE3YPY0_9ACTN|nr:DUF4232 domain-containing protein [Catenuloplanes atrovinosus]MDR7277520.1 hypothetical protein [Catenuloplanes atrovinosus]
MRSLRVRASVVSAAALALLLSGCGAEERDTAEAAASPVQSAATAAPNPSEPGRCRTADLTVTIADRQGGQTLTFTNVSAQPCTLEGFPGVTFVAGDEGAQVGAEFAHDGDKAEKLTLKPGDSARSDLVLTSPGAAKCKGAEATGFRILPPQETTAIFVSSPQQACTETDKGVGKVRPFSA